MKDSERRSAPQVVVPISQERASRIVLWLLAIAAVAHLTFRLRRAEGIGFLNYNEGWNAYHALRYATTGTPYPPLGALVVNNYPPLWFPLVAFVGRFTETYIEAGRVIATLGLAGVLIGLAAIGRELRGRLGAIAAFAIGAYFFGTQAANYIGTADPQMLAQAIGILALFLALRAGNTTGSKFQWAIALAALAGFVKHNLLALPAALMLSALADGRATFLRATFTAACSLAVGYLISAGVGGWDWPAHLSSARTYSLWKGFAESLHFLQLNVVGLAFAVAGLWTLPPGFAKRLLACYLVASVLIAVGFVGGAGVAINIFFDTIIATTIGAVLFIDRSVRLSVHRPESETARVLPPWALTAMTGVWLVAASGAYTRDVIFATYTRMRTSEEYATAMASDVAFLRASPGNAICDKPDLCFRAGKSFIYDPFNAGQALITGRISATDMREQLIAADVQIIHVSGPPSLTDSVPPPIATQVAGEFMIGRTNVNGTFLVRRSTRSRFPSDSGADGN